MAANDVLTVTFYGQDPGTSEFTWTTISSVIEAIDGLAYEVARRFIVEKPGSGVSLALVANPRAGSLELRFRLKVEGKLRVFPTDAASTNEFLKTAAKVGGGAGAAIVAAISIASDATQVIDFFATTIPAVIAANQGRPLQPGPEATDAEVAGIDFANADRISMLGSVEALEKAAQRSGCASITIQFRDIGPVEVVPAGKENGLVVGRALSRRQPIELAEYSEVELVPSKFGAVDVTLDGLPYKAFLVHNMAVPPVVALFPKNAAEFPSETYSIGIQGEILTEPARLLFEDSVPDDFRSAHGILVVRKVRPPWR